MWGFQWFVIVVDWRNCRLLNIIQTKRNYTYKKQKDKQIKTDGFVNEISPLAKPCWW